MLTKLVYYSINRFIAYVRSLIKIKGIIMSKISQAQKLEELLTKSVIPDLNERLDEIFEEVTDNKEASKDAKEEIDDLREFKADLQDVLNDIQSGDIQEDECKELINDILEAQKGDEEDFGFIEEN